MEFIRVFANPRRSMQRFGFLKYLVWRASMSATNNLATLGKDLIAATSQKVFVPLTRELQEYIQIALTDSIYRDLRSITSKQIEGGMKGPECQIEIQDLYLSDPGLPSRRGKLVGDDWKRYPQLAIDLGLLRKGTYSLLVRGQSFLILVPEEERKAFARLENISPKQCSNPLKLTMPQRLLLLFAFVERDGDVLQKLYKVILPISKSFTAKEAGDYLPTIYRTIAKQSRAKARSGDDLSRVQKLLDTADNIEAVKRNPAPGGKNAREHAITVRLEPFVDFGLLHKPDPFTYQYQVTNTTKTFFEVFIGLEDVETFLSQAFFDTVNKAFSLGTEHQLDRKAILSGISKAYTVLKSPLGYAPILDACLLGGIYSITEKGVYFEISEAIEVLKSFQKKNPRLVTFNVDRWGALTFFKYSNDIAKVIEE